MGTPTKSPEWVSWGRISVFGMYMESIDVLVQYLYVNFMHFAIFGFNKKLFCFVFLERFDHN